MTVRVTETASIAEEFCRAGKPVRLVRNPGNRGKGFAVRNGMCKARGEWLLFSDADLSTPISEIEKLMAAMESGPFAIAIGSRALDRSLVGVHQSPFRESAGKCYNLAMRGVLGLPLADTQCGFKLFRQDAARAIFQRQKLERFSFDAEILFIARKLGYRVAEVPVRWDNVEGTKVGVLSGAQSFLDLLRIRLHAARGDYRFKEKP